MNTVTEVPTRQTGIYRYSPGRALVVDSVFAFIISFLVVFLIRAKIWPLVAVAGFLLLKILKDLITASVIEVFYREPNMLYRRRFLLGIQNIEIPAWKISGTETRVVSMWRGNISEKLVLCVDGRELLLHPSYSGGDPATATVYQDINSLKSSAEAFLERKARKAVEEAEKLIEADRVEKTIWCMIEMSIQCPRCEAHVPVNGPFTDLQCPECFEKIELSPGNWVDLLEDVRDETADEMDPGEGSNSSIMGVFNTALLYGRLVPYCPECKTDFNFDIEKDYGGKTDSVVCSSCGVSVPVTKPPKWFDTVFRGAELIVSATGSTDLKTTAPEPVVVTCPACNAPFETKGEARNVPCTHCDTSVFLPDDLWYYFHPVPVKKRWFVGFTALCDSED